LEAWRKVLAVSLGVVGLWHLVVHLSVLGLAARATRVAAGPGITRLRWWPGVSAVCVIGVVGAVLLAGRLDVVTIARGGHVALAREMLAEDRPDEAMAHGQAAVDDSPDDPEAWVVLAEAHLVTGRIAQSLDCSMQAVAIDATNARAWYVNGMAMLTVGRPADALNAFGRALDCEPKDTELRKQIETTIKQVRAQRR